MNLTKIFDQSGEVLIAQVAERTVSAILHAWNDDRDAHVVVTGGRLGVPIAKAIDFGLFRATSQVREKKRSKAKDNFGKLHIWFGDERFVSQIDPDRNDEDLLRAFKLVGQRAIFHRVQTPDDLLIASAAGEYSEQLRNSLGDEKFDVVILSLGEDGHVASCFPGDDKVLYSTERAVAVEDSPKPPSARVTITLHQLTKCNQMYVLAIGESKREALTQTLAQADWENPTLPVELMRRSANHGALFVLTDLN